MRRPTPQRRSRRGRSAGFWRFAWGVLACIGLLAVIVLLLACTPVPWRAYLWLATDSKELDAYPECIVVLGGGGIPSDSGLLRTYYGAEVAKEFPRAYVIAALPEEEDREGPTSPEKMKQELVMRGVAPDQVLFEKRGRNTREQALQVKKMLGEEYSVRPVIVVTSAEHMKRSLLAFRKVGIRQVAGRPAMPVAVDKDLSYEADAMEGGHKMASKMAGGMFVRYQFWNNLGYMRAVARELVALGYYKLQGWI